MTQGAFEGVKVIEFGHFLLVPTATAILADWGADVIKVENFKTGGDPVRFPSAIEGQAPPADIKPSMWFHYFNRNKRSIGLNAMTERGREIITSWWRKQMSLPPISTRELLRKRGLTTTLSAR